MRWRMSLGVPKVRESMSSVEMPYTYGYARRHNGADVREGAGMGVGTRLQPRALQACKRQGRQPSPAGNEPDPAPTRFGDRLALLTSPSLHSCAHCASASLGASSTGTPMRRSRRLHSSLCSRVTRTCKRGNRAWRHEMSVIGSKQVS